MSRWNIARTFSNRYFCVVGFVSAYIVYFSTKCEQDSFYICGIAMFHFSHFDIPTIGEFF